MASDGSVPNGAYAQQGYDASTYTNGNTAATYNHTQAQPAQQQSSAADIPKDEVGWYFVEQYYTTLSKTPEKLYLFYNKRSQFVSGTEEDKVQVCVGQRPIQERIRELEFQDTKVRVTNVDSQGADANIVIQVIGEISNKGQPHKRFVQTFVLAEQTNGYFVLNDIFRYLAEDVAEEEAAEPAAPAEGIQEPAPSVAAESEPVQQGENDVAKNEEDLEKVDEKLETAQEEPAAEEPAAETNGAPAAEAAPEPAEESAEEAPAAATEEAPKEEEAAAPVAEEQVEEEKPKEPAPTPAPAQKPAAAPAATPKPAVPRTWASLAASANKSAAPAAAATAPATQQAPAQKAAAPAAAQPQAAPAAKEAGSAREASPVASQGDAGWQSVSGHKKEQSRAQNQAPPANPEAKRAFINGVYSQVQEQDLKDALSKFGEIVYFDISRQKNCAFVDFKTAPQFEAAVAANPHRINGVDLTIEERRQRPNKGPGFNPYPRGGAPRGRGMNGPRGGFSPRGGRGGAPRGGRPAPQEA